MGANAQTSVPTFTSGQVLTAAQQNESARTGVPVFATTGTRDAAFGGTGEKTLAEGQLAYVEGTGLQSYNGTSWVTWGAAPSAGALVYITGASFTTVTSVSLPNSTFTSTYRNYRFIFNITAVTSDADFTIRMRASGSDDTNNSYATMLSGFTNTAATSNIGTDATSFNAGESDASLVRYSFVADVLQPQIATATNLPCSYAFVNKAQSAVVMRTGVMQFTTGTQFDSLSFISSVASSITGTYRVYGYADS
jgi:hypothetical protein